MKKPGPFFSRFEGTIMIFSLVIILGGTLVLAGWAQMMATRATYTAMTEEGQKRRIAIANGRALARQYALNQMPSGSIQTTNFSLANDWGGFAINFASGLWTNTNFVEGNPFNRLSGRSFVVTNLGTISNSVEDLNWTFLVRSRSPLLAGYPIAVQNPGSTNLAAWASNTYKIYWSNALGFTSSATVPFTSGTNASGAGTNGYIGYFASPMNTNYAYADTTGLSVANATSNGVTVTTTTNIGSYRYITNFGGTLDVVLNSAQTNIILRFVIPNVTNGTFTNEVNGTNIITTYTNARVTNLILTSSASTNTLHLIADSGNTNLAYVTLSGNNNARRIYLNRDGGSLTLRTETSNANYSWWMGMTLANSGSAFTVLAPTNTRSLTLQGGIRTDRTINVNQGNLVVISNSAPSTNTELVTDRILWLEDQRSP